MHYVLKHFKRNLVSKHHSFIYYLFIFLLSNIGICVRYSLDAIHRMLFLNALFNKKFYNFHIFFSCTFPKITFFYCNNRLYLLVCCFVEIIDRNSYPDAQNHKTSNIQNKLDISDKKKEVTD